MEEVAIVFAIILYFIFLITIGARVSHLVKTSEDYFIAGRNLGFLSFMVLVISSIISGMTIIGASGLSFEVGWPSMWEPIFVTFSVAILITVFGAKLYRISRKFNYYTVQDYLSHRYQSPNILRAIAGVSGVIISFIYLTGQLTAISIVLSWLLKIDHFYALLIGTVVIIIYVFLGGLYAIAYTTLFQGIALFLGTLIVAPLIINAAGGLTYINQQLAGIDPSFINMAYPQAHPPVEEYAFLTPLFIVSFFFLLSFGLSTAPHTINNILSARKASYFKWAPLCAFAVYIVAFYLIKLAGFSARVLHEKGAITVIDPDYALIQAVEYALPPLAWIIFAVIVLAAVMSTTDRLLLTIGTTYGWDIHRNLFQPDISDKKLHALSRIIIILAGALAFLAAINPPDLLAWLIWMAIGLMVSTFCAPLLAGLYWKRANRLGAIWGMSVGLFTALCFGYIHQFVTPLPVHFSFFGLVASLLVLIVVSLLTSPPPEELIEETETGFYINASNSSTPSRDEK